MIVYLKKDNIPAQFPDEHKLTNLKASDQLRNTKLKEIRCHSEVRYQFELFDGTKS